MSIRQRLTDSTSLEDYSNVKFGIDMIFTKDIPSDENNDL